MGLSHLVYCVTHIESASILNPGLGEKQIKQVWYSGLFFCYGDVTVWHHIVTCQAHPALVKWVQCMVCLFQIFVLSMSGAKVVCWRPHLAGTRQYIWNECENVYGARILTRGAWCGRAVNAQAFSLYNACNHVSCCAYQLHCREIIDLVVYACLSVCLALPGLHCIPVHLSMQPSLSTNYLHWAPLGLTLCTSLTDILLPVFCFSLFHLCV